MFNRTGGRVKLLRLPARPTFGELQNYVAMATKDRETRFNYFWTTQRNEEFMLSFKSAADTVEWRMYQGARPNNRELWFCITTDLRQVYTQLVRAVGEELSAAMQADGMPSLAEPPAAQPAQSPQSGQSLLKGAEALSGNLSIVHITNLLQSLSLGQMSGRLQIQGPEGTIQIFFDQGTLVHATGPNSIGIECVYEALGLKEGLFNFDPLIKPTQKTIHQAVQSALMQGMLILDKAQFLSSSGIDQDSILTRTGIDVSEADFETLVATEEDMDLAPMKRIFSCIDNRRTLIEIIAKLQMPRSQWVVGLANLIRANLVGCAAEVPASKPAFSVAPKKLDQGLLESSLKLLTRPDTGLYSYQALLFLLDYEMKGRGHGPLSLIVFELQPAAKSSLLTSRQQLTAGAIYDLGRKISSINRSSDILAHFEGNDFALLLRNTKTPEASITADRIISLLSVGTGGLEGNPQSMAFGVACLPLDVPDMFSLLSAAELAKNHAKQKGLPVMLFRDMSQ